MKIAEIRETTVPIRSSMKNAYISFAEMTVSIVAVITDVRREGRPVVGFGFNSNGRYAQGGILQTRMVPRLLRAPTEALLSESGSSIDPLKAWDVMMGNEKPGGHGDRSVAVGILDMAFCDLAAKLEEKPLHRLLWDRFGSRLGLEMKAPDERVFVYAAGGYYDEEKGLDGLTEEMRRYLDMGYSTVKMKIGGAPLSEDLARIEAVLKLLPSGERLAVDANGRFDQKTAIEYAHALAPYELKWYEEPGDPLDYELNAAVRAESKTPLATGENLFSRQEVLNLLRYGGMNPKEDFLQTDPALAYGLSEYLRIAELLRENGWKLRRCIPHGGHQFALQIASGIGLYGNESYPGIFAPFGGFADEVQVEEGYVRNPEAPGIGIEHKAELYSLFRELID
ncbi:MAG TPA: enolase C-terminal domain-like protein [Spirochaetia bacterium]|nr:enolase C-terminal domain-like protein [Spirochaetia bacterium]